MKYSGCIALYRPFSPFAFSTRENGFRGTIRKSIGLCCLLCSVPEGATLSDGKVACPVYKWVGVKVLFINLLPLRL